MKKLIKVIALKDGFMESGQLFCIKDKEYEIVDQTKTMFCFRDEENELHWWDLDYNSNFKLIYEGIDTEDYSDLDIIEDLLINNNITVEDYNDPLRGICRREAIIDALLKVIESHHMYENLCR